MPSLLHLPPDILTTILTLALAHASTLSLSGIYPPYHDHGATTTLTRTHLAPTKLNRQLRREALPIFYASNTFTICLQPVCVKYLGKRKGKWREIFRRNYGDERVAGWFADMDGEAVREVKSLRVYVACVTRWDSKGDEVHSEREKFRGYGVGEGATRKMTEHVLYNKCS